MCGKNLQEYANLGAFVNLLKATITFVTPISMFVRPFARFRYNNTLYEDLRTFTIRTNLEIYEIKAILAQVWTDPERSTSSRLPDFQTTSTSRWPYAWAALTT
jgi:hypothetical protein